MTAAGLIAALVGPALAATTPALPMGARGPGGSANQPAVPHVTTDPLLPQAYRVAPPGEYPCAVDIDVSSEGRVTDVRAVSCDQDAFWALAAAIVQWQFDPALQDGVPIASTLPYTSVFEVRSALPRKNVVGYMGVAASVGGAGLAGGEARIHLGETLSASLGVDVDTDASAGGAVVDPVVRGDLAFSSRRRHFEKRGIYGFTLGAYGDARGGNGVYAAGRGEIMAGPPGLALGADAGVAVNFGIPKGGVADVGPWAHGGLSPIYPWFRASLIWYAPLPRDRFVVVPRASDPLVYEAELPPEETVEDQDGGAFPGIPAIHWSEIEPSMGDAPSAGAGFALYPPGSYTCNVRVAVDEAGMPAQIRVEMCPQAGRADAEATVRAWRWNPKPGRGVVQAVFPAPIFVDQPYAEPLRAQSVQPLVDGQPRPLPARAHMPDVWARARVLPDYGITRPTRSCYVDVDLDLEGKVTTTRWISGDIEVRPRVEEALAQWGFYPVIVAGERTPARVRLVLCED